MSYNTNTYLVKWELLRENLLPFGDDAGLLPYLRPKNNAAPLQSCHFEGPFAASCRGHLMDHMDELDEGVVDAGIWAEQTSGA